MAVAQITVYRPLADAEADSILHAVRGALVEALQVPSDNPDDPRGWITEQRLDLVHPKPSYGTETTFVQVTLFSGRSTETKHRLHREISDRLEAAAVPAGAGGVVLIEAPIENWSTAGVPADQVDLGFRIDI